MYLHIAVLPNRPNAEMVLECWGAFQIYEFKSTTWLQACLCDCMDRIVMKNRHVYRQNHNVKRTEMQVLHEILAQMQLDGFTRGQTTIYESGPMAKVEYTARDLARSRILRSFRRKKQASKIELKIELRPNACNPDMIEVISELRELNS